MAFDDDIPSSDPTLVMPVLPIDGVPPPPLPPSPPGPIFPPAGGAPGPNPNRTPMIIAGVGAALIVLFAVIFAVTRDTDDEIATSDSTLPLTLATSSLPSSTSPASSSTAPATTAPATVATTAPTTGPTTAPTTSVAPTTTPTTVAPTTTIVAAIAPTTTAAPTTVAPTTTAASTTSTTVATRICTSADLAVTIGDSEGATGSVFTEVYVTNTGGTKCILDSPGVMSFTAAGGAVGAVITATSTIDLELAPGGVATALWRMARTDLFDCTPSGDTEIVIGFGAATVPAGPSDPVCANPPEEQGTLQGFTAGMSDLVSA